MRHARSRTIVGAVALLTLSVASCNDPTDDPPAPIVTDDDVIEPDLVIEYTCDDGTALLRTDKAWWTSDNPGRRNGLEDWDTAYDRCRGY